MTLSLRIDFDNPQALQQVVAFLAMQTHPPKVESPAADAPPPELTEAGVRAAFQAYYMQHGAEAAKARLAPYGAAKFGGVPQDKWPEFLGSLKA